MSENVEQLNNYHENLANKYNRQTEFFQIFPLTIMLMNMVPEEAVSDGDCLRDGKQWVDRQCYFSEWRTTNNTGP